MYCPKCKDVMVEEGGIFTCVRGKMPTTVDLARRLREYEEKGVSPAAGKTTGKATRMGGHWFCPCCGTDLEEEETSFHCRGCGRYLSKFVAYILVEFHPHWTNNSWK